MGRLVQLIYVSSAARLLDEQALRAILESSIRHNTPQAVTGMLLYANGAFMQVLEGDEAAVAETMSRIRADPRHHDIYELCASPVTAREFGAWSMGFRALTPADASTWPGYAQFFEHGLAATALTGAPGLAVEMLKTFARKNGG